MYDEIKELLRYDGIFFEEKKAGFGNKVILECGSIIKLHPCSPMLILQTRDHKHETFLLASECLDYIWEHGLGFVNDDEDPRQMSFFDIEGVVE